MENKRFNVFFEKHVGLGIRWNNDFFGLEISIALPFITITLGLGEDKLKCQ